MKICSKCNAPIDDTKCPICGKAKDVIDAKDNDFVLVATKDYISSQLCEDILKDANIKFLKKGALGAAVTVYIGHLAESFSFYVLAKDYEEACKLINNFESSEEDLGDE